MMIDLKEVEAEEKLTCKIKSRQFLWKGEIKDYLISKRKRKGECSHNIMLIVFTQSS